MKDHRVAPLISLADLQHTAAETGGRSQVSMQKILMIAVLGLATLLLGVTNSRSLDTTETLDTTKRHGGLELADLRLPKGTQIMGVELHLAGTFESVSNIPTGWTITVDNADSPGIAKLEGHTKGAFRTISEYELRNIGLQVMVTQLEDLRPQVWGWIIVASTGQEKEKRLPLSFYNFNFVESYHRHRLSQDASALTQPN